MHTQVDEAALVEVVRHVKAMGYNPYIDPLSVWIEPDGSTANINEIHGELKAALDGNWWFVYLKGTKKAAVIVTPEHLKVANRDSEFIKRLFSRLDYIATTTVH